MTDLLNLNNRNINSKKIESEIEKRINNRKEKLKEYNTEISDFKILDTNLLDDLNDHLNIKIPKQITSHIPIIGSIINKQAEINIDVINRLNKLERIAEENEIRIKRLNKLMEENTNQVNSNIKEIFKLKKKLSKKYGN